MARVTRAGETVAMINPSIKLTMDGIFLMAKGTVR